jgi:hypothetical protein
MSLQEILKKIREVKPFTEEDTDQGPTETMSGRRGRKMRAVDELKDLTSAYKLELINSAMFILVVGGERDAFVQTATGEDFKLFSANPSAFYEDLVNRIPATVYEGKTSSSDLFSLVGRHLEDMAQELGILEYPQLVLKREDIVSLNTKEDLAKLLKRSINAQVGGELAGVYAIQSILNKAIETGHSTKTTPVMLSTEDETLALELKDQLKRLNPRTFLVASGKVPKYIKNIEGIVLVKDGSKENVELALSTIKNLVRK